MPDTKSDPRILITGCSSGLGYTLLDAAVKRCIPAFGHYRDSAHRPGETHLAGDMRCPSFYRTMRQFMLSNRIDTIINNAGVYQSGPLEDLGNDQISDVIRVNLTSQILAIQTAYNLFKADGRGTIVNINSLAGITPSANETVYAAAKHGFRGFSKSLQLEAIGTGIEIIDVFPGAMKTQMTKDRPNHDQLMDPAEVADTVLDMITSTRRLSINEMVIRRKP